MIADSAPRDLKLDLPADAPVLITLAARDVDVRAAIVRDGSIVGPYADAPNRRMGVETLLLQPPHEGALHLRVERADHAGARGRVAITIVALPTRTADDRKRLAAARLSAGACLAYPEAAQGRASAEAFAAAAELQREAGDRPAAGIAWLQAAGAHYARLDDWSGAADLAARAAEALADGGMPDRAAFALRVEGAALAQLANATDQQSPASRRKHLRRARTQLADAARRFRLLGLSFEAGYAINYRGVSYQDAGERELARADFQQALELFRAAGDEPAQALSYQSLAVLSHEDGRLADAMREFDHALALIPRATQPGDYAHTLHNSALPLRVLGRFDEAIARFFEAGRLLRELGDTDGEARALHGLGTTLLYAGEPDRAAELLRTAIGLRGTGSARREQAISLLVLGQIEREAGNIDTAVALHRQAMTLAQAPHDQAQVHLALARDLLARGDRPGARRALDALLQLDLPPAHRYLGLALTEVGTWESLAGHEAEANAAFARAIAIHEGNGSDLELAGTLHQRARARLQAGDAEAALADSAAALEIYDAVGFQGARIESRASFRATYREVVELRIAALLDQAEAAQRQRVAIDAQRPLWDALAASDRSRARLLTESPPGGAGVPAALLEQRKTTYDLLAGKRYQKDRALDAPKPDVERLTQLTREIAWLRTQASLLEERIASSETRPGSLAANGPVEPAAAIPPNVVVAEYFIGDRQSWLFEVRTDAIAVHRLPDRPVLERMARDLHLSWRKPGAARDRGAEARELAQALFAPLGDATPGLRIHIVPDGPLHLVPMALLAQQRWPALPAGGAMIIPSLSAVRLQEPGRAPAADRLLAVIADPIYSATDGRIEDATRSAVALGDAPATRAGIEFDSLRRLPSTAIEARDLVALVEDPDEVLVLLGPDASRQRFTSAPMARYRILHFATHAIADSRDPALATLLLSRWNAAGEPVDGALRMYDITALRLNADLVVLSGCDTALGREIAGEGLLGLSQAFLRSGARSVLASLWQVPDRSTALLMREFYRQLLTRQQSAAVSLQLAQQAVRRQARWSDPYYWAGFQLVSTDPEQRSNDQYVERREETR